MGSSGKGTELEAAIERHRSMARMPRKAGHELWVVAEIVKAFYRACPRREIFVSGNEVPESLIMPLLEELRRTRWPPAPHRFGMRAAHYLVLHHGQGNDGFETLMDLLNKLLE